MRTHGWAGQPPADDDEAVRRILAAAKTCIDRGGSTFGIADVARHLGVTRQTVYRYFPSTDDLLNAAALSASTSFLAAISAHLDGRTGTPSQIVVEGLAFALERLPEEPYLGLLLTSGRVGAFAQSVTSETALSLGRTIIELFPVDWEAHGFDGPARDGLVEQMLRMMQSYVVDPGTPPRTGAALRAYFERWLAPAIDAQVRATT